MLCWSHWRFAQRFTSASRLEEALHLWRRGALGHEMPGLVRAVHATALSSCQEEHQQRRELCIQVSQ